MRITASLVDENEDCLRCGMLFERERKEESPFCGTFCKGIFWKLTPDVEASPL